MLVNFRFKNCRSFLDETVFSMEATKDTELKDINTFNVEEKLMPKDENTLLKSSVIFGGNASGKSNIIKALAYMKNVLLLSASQFPIVAQNESFAFLKNNNEESLYEVEIIQNKTFYRYGFTLLHGEVVSEWLDRRTERLTPVFRRNYDELEIAGLPKQATKLINIGPNTLFLSVGNNFHLNIASQLADVMNWFQSLLIVFENNANSVDIYTMEHGKYREQAIKILKLADIGIKDFRVKKDKVANMADFNDILRFNAQLQINPAAVQGQLKQEESNLYNIDLETDFEVFDRKGNVSGKKSVLLFQNSGFNSEGTTRLLCYLGWILAALDQGRVILIDEMDSKLHFLVADYIMQLFNSIDSNAKNAQLICTAHSILLMDEGLRRDQIYFTSKDSYGKSSLVSLSDYKNVRKSDLFSKKYLAGFYSDLPDMKNSD